MTIIIGEVVGVSSVPMPRRSPRWPWVLSAAWFLTLAVGAVPVAWVAVPVVRAQTAAERGSNSPATALLEFAFTFEDPTGPFPIL